MKRLARYLLMVVLGLLIVNLFIEPVVESRSLYFPVRVLGGDPASMGLEYEDVYLTTADGVKINGWFVKNETSPKVILLFHGNGGNLSHRLDTIRLLHALPSNIFAIDYHGFGRSGGQPSEKNLYLDAEAAYRYLVEEKNYSPSNIIIMGSSLGGAVATYLAEREKIGGLVLLRAFTSAPAMAPRVNPLYRWPIIWPRSRFDSLGRMSKIQVPLLIVHSRQDEMIPYQMAVALYERANQPKELLLLEKGGHNDPMAAPEYLKSLRRLLGRNGDQ